MNLFTKYTHIYRFSSSFKQYIHDIQNVTQRILGTSQLQIATINSSKNILSIDGDGEYDNAYLGCKDRPYHQMSSQNKRSESTRKNEIHAT